MNLKDIGLVRRSLYSRLIDLNDTRLRAEAKTYSGEMFLRTARVAFVQLFFPVGVSYFGLPLGRFACSVKSRAARVSLLILDFVICLQGSFHCWREVGDGGSY